MEQTFTVTCAAEDTNRNGLMEAGEDRNGGGELDPRKSDVSISMIGSTKTNASGTAIVQIEYPKNLGSWVHFKISVSAAGVLSPPAIWTDYLPVLAGDLKSKVPPPAFVNSRVRPVEFLPRHPVRGHALWHDFLGRHARRWQVHRRQGIWPGIWRSRLLIRRADRSPTGRVDPHLL